MNLVIWPLFVDFQFFIRDSPSSSAGGRAITITHYSKGETYCRDPPPLALHCSVKFTQLLWDQRSARMRNRNNGTC